MQPSHQPQAIRIIGLELRTHNAEAAQTIPPFWGRFMAQQVLQALPGRLSDEVWAVYTHFEHAGLDNQGLYSLVIGAAVPADAAVPPGLVQAVLPAGPRMVFEVPGGRPDRVGETWQQVWQHHGLPKSFIADAEHYRADGRIEISVGLHRPA